MIHVKRTFLSILALVSFFNSVLATAAIETKLPSGINQIIRRHKLVVVMPSEDSKPFFMTNAQGATFGLDAMIAKNIADRFGVELVIDRTAKSYDDAVKKVAAGMADLAICHLTVSLEREMSVAFSTPYIQSKHLLLLNRKATIQYHLSETEYSDELAGKKISLGVKSGSFFATQVRKDFPFAKISFFNTDDELYTSVESGAVSAVLTDEVSIQNWQSEHPRFAFYVKKLYRKNRSGHIAIAVNWGSNPLLQWVNLYLETIRNDGTLEKWIHGFLVEQVWKKSQ